MLRVSTIGRTSRRRGGGGGRFIFRNWMGEDQQTLLRPLMEALPLLPGEYRCGGRDYRRPGAPLQPPDGDRVSSASAEVGSVALPYQALSKYYGWWMQIPHANLAYLIDLADQVCLLLSTHWIALKKIMATITDAENLVNPNSQGGDNDSDKDITRWLRYLNRQIDAKHQQHNQWPLLMQAQLDRDLQFFSRSGHSQAQFGGTRTSPLQRSQDCLVD